MAVSVVEREYKGAAVVTSLVGNISNTDTSITVDAATSWPTGSPGPFSIVVDQGLSTEEKILIESRTGNVLTVASGGRGWDGTSAASHSNGASVAHCLDAATLQNLNDFASDLANFGARLDTEQQFAERMEFDGGLNVQGLEISGNAGTGKVTIEVTNSNDPSDLEIIGHGDTAKIKLIPSHASLTEFLEIGPDAQLKVNGSLHRFGAGAHGGTGTYAQIGSNADAANAWLDAAGSPTDVGLKLRSKGAGVVSILTGGLFSIKNIADSTTQLSLSTAGALKATSAKFGTDADPAPNFTHGVQGAAAGTKVFGIKMAASQTADPFQIVNNNDVKLVGIEASGAMRISGSTNRFGAGAQGGTGTNVALGDLGDAAGAYLIAEGSPTNVALRLRSKGTSGVSIEKADGTSWLLADTTGENGSDDASSIQIRVRNSNKRIYQGAADSGGSGWRMLRVGN